MITIFTKFAGATDYEGSRILVKNEELGNTSTPYKYELGVFDNHREAAHDTLTRLIEQEHVDTPHCSLVPGAMPDGSYVWVVNIDQDDEDLDYQADRFLKKTHFVLDDLLDYGADHAVDLLNRMYPDIEFHDLDYDDALYDCEFIARGHYVYVMGNTEPEDMSTAKVRILDPHQRFDVL